MADDLQAIRQALMGLDGSPAVQTWLACNVERIVQAIVSKLVVQIEEPLSDEPSLSISVGAMAVTYVPLFDVVDESLRWHAAGGRGESDPFGVLHESYVRRCAERRRHG